MNLLTFSPLAASIVSILVLAFVLAIVFEPAEVVRYQVEAVAPLASKEDNTFLVAALGESTALLRAAALYCTGVHHH